MAVVDQHPTEARAAYGSLQAVIDGPPTAINWNLLTADEAEYRWRDLDAWVKWLKASFGLTPTIVPPYWHRHDELVWELSALHTHWLACYHETAGPSDPIRWLGDFTEAKARLRDWVSICGTRLDRDRPTRQTNWPGETPENNSGEVEILDRNRDFEAFVREDLQQRRRIEALVAEQLTA
ncbi:hypothetical protein EXE58_19065 [Nocardioides seonyuensis]|uniref:DUF4913 domain-containing protein n=1 Tax=Nocardioides seonyuensis TaxID=2518371 RepID=A0A4P7IIX0_9ACTN|nr:hypothetical protein [Nocardioides seonyuensis]QBX57318.1 hypothetical protein EXE58_19065 [Nocardioides seonyuensis]